MTEPAHDRYDQGRCPRCASWKVLGTSAGNWCEACDLVTTGSRAEWDRYATERAQWAAGTHPAQQPPAPPLDRPDGGHDHHACMTCGKPHANKPDLHAPRPRTVASAALEGARRWDGHSRRAAVPRDPDGVQLTYRPADDRAPPRVAIDPGAAEAALLADIDAHRAATANRRPPAAGGQPQPGAA